MELSDYLCESGILMNLSATSKKEIIRRRGDDIPSMGEGVRIFKNGVDYLREAIESGRLEDVLG